MKPKLTDTQTDILTKLANGWQIGVGSGPHGHVWLQCGGAGRGGETEKVRRDDLYALHNHRLIYVSKDSFPTSTWDITESGVAFLKGEWTDELHRKVAALLSDDGRPLQVIQEEEAHLPPAEHPSYGQIGINHITGGGGALYGATVNHPQRIALRIMASHISRHDSHEAYHGGKEHIEVEMSYDQFVSLLFSAGRGDGVPCTITSLAGKPIEAPELVSRRAQIAKHFEKTMADVTDNATTLRAEAERILKSPGAMKAADKEYLLSIMNRLVQDVSANVPFIQKQFQQALDRSVAEAQTQLVQAATAIGAGKAELPKLGA